MGAERMLGGILGAGGEPGGMPGGPLDAKTAYSLAGSSGAAPELVLCARLVACAADLRGFSQWKVSFKACKRMRPDEKPGKGQ